MAVENQKLLAKAVMAIPGFGQVQGKANGLQSGYKKDGNQKHGLGQNRQKDQHHGFQHILPQHKADGKTQGKALIA